MEKMIVFEDVLEEMFDYIPAMQSPLSSQTFKPYFGYGDQKELGAFLKNNSKPYPLIWLIYPYTENHKNNKVQVEKAELILAVNTNASMMNKARLNETFKKILFPLFDSVKHCIKTANVTNSSGEFKVIKYPNYSDSEISEEHFTTDIWDALKITFDIEVLATCLKPIKFPK